MQNSVRLPLMLFVTGPSCTGKTTLAHHLADRYQLPMFHKDAFKERMYDAACPDGDYDTVITRDFSRLLGKFSLECITLALEECARTHVSAIFEANFDSRIFSPRVAAIRARYPFTAVQFHLSCDGDVLLQRFVQRETTERHPGHGGLRHLEELKASLLRGNDVPLVLDRIDFSMEIDTTDIAALDLASIDIVVEQLMKPAEPTSP